METTASSTAPKKKALKDAFHGSAGGFFSQKKKVVLGNVKHFGNKRDISLSKFGSSGSVYFDVESLSGEDEDVSMSGTNVNTGAGFGSPLGSPNFHMDDNEVVLLSHLPISLEKKWIDPKIIKTSVEVSIRKLFALDINLSAVEGKLAMAKTQLIRKIFSTVNGFGGATTPSKFEGIIQLMFMSEKSMEMATSLAKEKGIDINGNLKKQKIRSDQAVVIKEISIDMSKDIIVTAVSEFGEIKSIKIQLMRMWQKTVVEFAESDQANSLASKWSFLIGKNSVYIAKTVGDCETWTSKDQFRVLLFTLLIGTTAYNLRTLLEKTNGKTCVINRSLGTGNRICCTVVGFESDNNLESVFCMKPILGSVRLSWTRMDLVWCERCGKFGHSALKCDASVATTSKPLKKPFIRVVSDECYLQLAKLYEKKSVLISCPAAFSNKFWIQMVSLAGFSDGFHFVSGFSSSLSSISGLNNSIPPISVDNSFLDACLIFLEQSLELLTDQVSDIMQKLSNMKLDLVVDVVMDDSELVLSSPSSAFLSISTLGLSSSKILTTKIGCLESKLVAFEASIGSVLAKLKLICAGSTTCNVRGINIPAKQEDIVRWHKKSANKFDEVRIFLTGLDKGFLGAGVAIIMNNNLAHYVCKIEKIPGWIILVQLLFKGKLLVSILSLYASVSTGAKFSQVLEINAFIAKAVNSSTFLVVLDHLVVDNDLVLEFSEVKSTVDTIMESWTKKRAIPDVLPARWAAQYAPLMVKCLPDGKAAGLSGIPNKLWKHGDVQVLGGLLDIFNVCLVLGAMPVHWKYTWVSMISKLYDWKGTLTNTKPIALVETSQKILSKILSDRISVTCSKFNVLQGDNFLVLKSTSTQIPIFAIGLIVKDALEKNKELLARIKMCLRFIRFFGSLHNGRFNRVMTNFGFTDSYVVYDDLDQREIGFKNFRSGLTSFLAVEVFVDDTIWIDKTVAIPINMKVENPWLFISGAVISIAKKKKPHRYLDIFLSTNGFFIPSLAKAHSDVHQLQTENLLASVVGFANSGGILSRLFEYRVMDLQTVSWMPQQPLSFLVKLSVNPINCFLASMTNMFASCGSSLVNNILNVFQSGVGVLVANVLGLLDHNGMCFTWSTFCQWKRLDPKGWVPGWFVSLVLFIFSGGLASIGALVYYFISDIHLCNFGFANGCLIENRPGIVSVYTDGSVKGLGFAGTCGDTAAYFSDVDLSVEIRVYGLLSSTLVELQAIALALECISTSSSVMLFTDSQASLDMCASLVNSVGPNFCDKCWIEKEHIHITIASKKLLKKWYKPSYPSMVCIYCDLVKDSDHMFLCAWDANVKQKLISDTIKTWTSLPEIGDVNCAVTHSLHNVELSDSLYIVLAKGFVLKKWVANTVHLLGFKFDGGLLVINLVCEFVEGH
ncbi:hypothetical protein G9A89_003569 [Geosiphon pyriformis]|nr:hypothetical protein G9A89_003569 [Geosiphon pyriformis]